MLKMCSKKKSGFQQMLVWSLLCSFNSWCEMILVALAQFLLLSH